MTKETLFLATGEVHKSEYMGKKTSEKVMRLVEAIDEDEAQSIFEAEYESKSSEYSVTYRVRDIEISPVLTRKSVGFTL